MTIIGITGTLGAGKGTIVDYLIKEKGFKHYSVREFLLEEMRRKGLPENRDSMYRLANELRAMHTPSYVTDQLYLRALKEGKDCVIESIRTPGEIDSLRKQGKFILFAVDAATALRYGRIQERKSETDQVSFETFISNEQREMSSTDPNCQNLRRCIEMADYLFLNNGTMIQLFRKVEKVLGEIMNEE